MLLDALFLHIIHTPILYLPLLYPNHKLSMSSPVLSKIHRDILASPPNSDLYGSASTLGPEHASSGTLNSLLQIEDQLYGNALNQQEIDLQFKSLAHLFKSPALNDLDAGLRLKYLDLLSDYQYLLQADVELRLVDLVSKKLNFLSSGPSMDFVSDAIKLKVLVYYLLCGADFRKANIHKYLNEENVFARDFHPAVQKYIDALELEKLVSLQLYVDFIDYLLLVSVEFKAIYVIHQRKLLENFVEINLERLPKYYTSVSLARIHSLILGSEATSEQYQNVDMEDVISGMIKGKNLSPGTKIDQIEGFVDFGEEAEKHDAFNAHIKKVCDLVESLALAA